MVNRVDYRVTQTKFRAFLGVQISGPKGALRDPGPICRQRCRLNIAWLSLCFILETSWVALYSVVCEWVCQASVSPDQISTFSNIYRHKSTLLTQYHLIPSSTKLYWPSTTMHQSVLPHTYILYIFFTTGFMSHARYTCSSFCIHFLDVRTHPYLWSIFTSLYFRTSNKEAENRTNINVNYLTLSPFRVRLYECGMQCQF